jgi:hypothetical protein
MRFALLILVVAALGGCGGRSPIGSVGDGGAGDDGGTGGDGGSAACPDLGETACLARADCHARYHVTECRNVLGYCAEFVDCRDGEANCLGPANCDIIEPFCAGPYVISYTPTCYGPCVRADQCAGCLDTKMAFTQADGCANDGSVEFCIPPVLATAIQMIAPTAACAEGTGQAGCDPATQLLCTFPTGASECVADHGALTDGAWGTLCGISMLPDVVEIVPTVGP